MNAFVDKSENITNILRKTFAVLEDLDAGIAKTQNTNLRYKYHENEDVLNSCRRAMLKHGLMLHTQGGAVSEDNKRYFQEFVFTLTDPETGEYIAFAWAGAIPCGMITKSSDWQEDDKAVGKLKSYAIKNWLLAEFLIGTPDQDTEVNPTAYNKPTTSKQPVKVVEEVQPELTPEQIATLEYEKAIVNKVTEIRNAIGEITDKPEERVLYLKAAAKRVDEELAEAVARFDGKQLTEFLKTAVELELLEQILVAVQTMIKEFAEEQPKAKPAKSPKA